MTKIHLFGHLNLPIFWLATCNFIGNQTRDSSLSPKYCNSSLSQLKNGLHSFLFYYKKYVKTISLDIWSLWCLAYTNLSVVTWHLYYSASIVHLPPESLGIHYLLNTWVTWHGLCFSQHMLLVRHELSKCLKCVETHLSKPIWDQQYPSSTWVSKTLKYTLTSLISWA